MISRIFRDDSDNTLANRKRQINTLKVFNDNVTEITEDVEYKVDFLSGETPMCLVITLPPEFPLEKPQLKIQPPVIHSWVDNNTEISNAPGLLNFTVHSDLGRVVQVIIREFQIRPPPIIGHKISVVEDASFSPTVSSNSTISPSYSESFPELNNMTLEELQRANDDTDMLDEIISNTRQFIDLNTAVDNLITNNEELAKENLSKQKKLEKLRKKVLKKLEHMQKNKKGFDDKNKEYEGLCQQFQPQNIKESLRLAAIQSDEESEIIAESFLNKEMDVEQFLVSYIEKRKLSQTRKTKEEKLSNQLKELQKAGF